MSRKIRLIDIAKEAGVSLTAVSKILGSNNCKGIGVCREKAELIRSIAAKYNYIPNISARALTGQGTKMFGILVDSRKPNVMSNLLAQIEQQASLRGYRVLVGEAHDNLDSLYENYKVLRQYGVDGILCMSHDYPAYRAKLDTMFSEDPNIVFLDKPFMKSERAYVSIDFETGMREALAHLSSTGRRRIGLAVSGNLEAYTIRKRIEIYESAIRGEHFLFDTGSLNADVEETRKAAGRIVRDFILKKKLDSILACNDFLGFFILEALGDAGLKVPDDVALVGFDNDIFSLCCRPSLTTIDQNTALVAEAFVDLLIKRISQTSQPPENVTIPTKLIIRESSIKKQP